MEKSESEVEEEWPRPPSSVLVSDPLPPPPPVSILRQPRPRVEDAFTAMMGIVLPKRAKKYKLLFSFIGKFELILGTYSAVFGAAACASAVIEDEGMNVGIYAGMCGVGLALLVSGGLKIIHLKNLCSRIFSLSMSLLSAILSLAVAGLCIWLILTRVTNNKKDDILPISVAAVMLATSLICLVHGYLYGSGINVSLEPINAIMYTNTNTGDQFVEYQDATAKESKKRREKRRAESFKKVAKDQYAARVPIHTPPMSRHPRGYHNQSLPMAPLVRNAHGRMERPTVSKEISFQTLPKRIADTD